MVGRLLRDGVVAVVSVVVLVVGRGYCYRGGWFCGWARLVRNIRALRYRLESGVHPGGPYPTNR